MSMILKTKWKPGLLYLFHLLHTIMSKIINISLVLETCSKELCMKPQDETLYLLNRLSTANILTRFGFSFNCFVFN